MTRLKDLIHAGDYHMIVNDKESAFESEVKMYDSQGTLLWKVPGLAKGQTSDYTKKNGDTPPGEYRLGGLTVTEDHENFAIWASYGKYFFDLEGLDDYEERYYRAGCGVHGGGSNAPDPLADYQQLCPTYGCVRMYNKDIETKLLPVYQTARSHGNHIYVTVNQI